MRDRTLLIEAAVSLGELRDTKTGQRRTVKLLAPLAHDLNEWRLASGLPVLYPRAAEQTAEPEAQCRTRTGDPFLTMEVLYQLS